MNFEIIVMLLSFIISMIISLITIPTLRKLKVGQVEREDGPKSHLKKQGTPTMGGIIMLISLFILSVIIGYIFKFELKFIIKLLSLVFLIIGFGLIGFIDDFKKLVLKDTKGLKPSYKMLGLIIVSVIYIIYILKVLNIGTETYIPIIKQYINVPIWAYIPCAVFVLVGTTNAVNLTDGVDGLATCVTIAIFTCLTIVSIKLGITEIEIISMILIGICMGFLVFNIHPAKVFMGDTGSLFLGGAIAGIALYIKMPLLLIIIAIIPIIETLSVMIQVSYYKKTKKRIFRMAPIHHHFELSGWKEEKVVFVFTGITIIACIFGLLVI